MTDLLDLIISVAEIPSFSSFEERIFPLIDAVVKDNRLCKSEKIEGNNIIIEVPGNREFSPVAITSHLDKINHFGPDSLNLLKASQTNEKIIGQLDDAAGIGICLFLLQKSKECNFPPLYFLFSEMEESFGLRMHPHLLKNSGNGLYPRIGAERIANHLIKSGRIPSIVLTIDTTPLFKGSHGIALYSKYWERLGITPTDHLVTKTDELVRYFQHIHPDIQLNNNTNDYIKYGEIFNRNNGVPIPSLAIEPSIFPYHSIGEQVFKRDVEKVCEIIKVFLENYPTVIV
jgi:hypothetical protein